MDHSLPKTSGYTIRAKYLLEAQVAAGGEVTVLTSPSQGPGAVADQIGGVSYRRSGYSREEQALVSRGAKHLVFGRAIRRALVPLLDEGRFDLVHAHTPFTVGRVALREARRRGLPLVYEKRNLWEESARARGKASGRWPFFQLARALDRRLTRGADAVCTITDALRSETLRLGVDSDRVFVVGNGVDTEAFVPRAPRADVRERCRASGSFVIGFVGSFFSFEGLPLLVEAFARLRRRRPGSRLVLVGDGEDRPLVERAVRDLGLGDGASLVGSVPHADVPDYYASMDVLVYPRYRSPLTEMISPLKPLEPMAMGRCVVGSDVGGIRELVRDGETGLLFPAGSPEGLEGKLERLVSGAADAAALGARAREHVVANRQWRHMARAYESAYARASRSAAAALPRA
jgi:PEP-CTERM/exosortase A-associated glycosyltransferase